MNLFKAEDAQNLTEKALAGEFISKGKVIDIIKSAAKKGETRVKISGLSSVVKSSLRIQHDFKVINDIISWEKVDTSEEILGK